MRFSTLPLFAAALALAAATVGAQSQQADLEELSIHDLLNFEVSSASKKLEPLSKTSAAITVITQQDIRRMGATSLPEALRMVPGLHSPGSTRTSGRSARADSRPSSPTSSSCSSTGGRSTRPSSPACTGTPTTW